MTSGQVIDACLDQIAAALPGPPWASRDIMAELRATTATFQGGSPLPERRSLSCYSTVL
jgi:hypothetical protein